MKIEIEVTYAQAASLFGILENASVLPEDRVWVQDVNLSIAKAMLAENQREASPTESNIVVSDDWYCAKHDGTPKGKIVATLKLAGINCKADSMPWGKEVFDVWAAAYGACIYTGSMTKERKKITEKNSAQLLNTYFLNDIPGEGDLVRIIKERGLWNERRKAAGKKPIHGLPGCR